MDPDFAEGLCEGGSRSLSNDRQAERKARQFCRQVQRALNVAMEDLFVEEVSPAPDCGRLLVRVLIPPGREVAEAMDAVRRDAPRLRSEVATAITRKRAPELFFIPALHDGGGDE